MESKNVEIVLTTDCDCHENKLLPTIQKKARNKLIASCVISVMFIIAEIIGGYLANSIAIASDAAHLLGDLASFLINLFALHFATRQPTRILSFGWYRAEILGALFAIFLLWLITCVLCYVATQRVIEQDFTVNPTIMLISASFGVVFNIIMLVVLHPGGHGHSHGGKTEEKSWVYNSDEEKLAIAPKDTIDGDTYTSYGGVSINETDLSTEPEAELSRPDGHQHSHNGNINVTASFLHVLGDLLQSIGVLVAAVIIYFKPEWQLADPICTFVFSVIVVTTTLPVLKDIFRVLMEGTPRHMDFKTIHDSLERVPEVKDIHDLRIWSLSMDKVVLSVHVVIAKNADSKAIVRKASNLLRLKYGITETTIQTEEYMTTMKNCSHCRGLKD